MLEDIIKERVKKLEKLRNSGQDPYPASSERDFSVSEVLNKFEDLSSSSKSFAIVGRVRGLRNQGGVIFADLEDESGRIQVIFKKDSLAGFDLIDGNLDIGDFMQVHGTPFLTKRGEKSVVVTNFKWLVKSLRPIPSDFYGLEDVETRLRKRYLDILSNKDVREIFVKKNVFWEEIRTFLRKAGFLGVEAPVLEAVPGGADAEPFVTHHNALDENFYLRISDIVKSEPQFWKRPSYLFAASVKRQMLLEKRCTHFLIKMKNP